MRNGGCVLEKIADEVPNLLPPPCRSPRNAVAVVVRTGATSATSELTVNREINVKMEPLDVAIKQPLVGDS